MAEFLGTNDSEEKGPRGELNPLATIYDIHEQARRDLLERARGCEGELPDAAAWLREQAEGEEFKKEVLWTMVQSACAMDPALRRDELSPAEVAQQGLQLPGPHYRHPDSTSMTLETLFNPGEDFTVTRGRVERVIRAGQNFHLLRGVSEDQIWSLPMAEQYAIDAARGLAAELQQSLAAA